MDLLGQVGMALPLALGAVGSALGIGAAARAAAGAWAKEGKAGKPLDFKYVILIGMPLTQTFYGFLLLFVGLRAAVMDPAVLAKHAGVLFSIALGCGLGELFSAWLQGLIGAAGVRCMSESEGKGLAFIIIAMGIVETVGLLSFVLLWLMLPSS
ncbi:MAG TPA: V-type ATP synthase subunit K [Phycisphaerae bacterium]|nr:V-type ATP synthase subunit K [Phycisphaerae bacterium]HUT61827.1 V-type ATP synthase subunit K [Phycisphaerae bacterium]